MKIRWMFVIAVLVFTLPGFSQSSPKQDSSATPQAIQRENKSHRPGEELAQGGRDIGKGAAKGSADLAKGTASAAGNLVTGHPVSAAASTGKGALGFGKNVGAGTGKGTLKIGKGVGGLLKKLGRNSKTRDNASR